MRPSKSKKTRKELPGKVVQLVETTKILETETSSPKMVTDKLTADKPTKIIRSKADFPSVPPQSYAQACQLRQNETNLNFATGHTGNIGFQRHVETPSVTVTPPTDSDNPTEKAMESWSQYFWSFVPFS